MNSFIRVTLLSCLRRIAAIQPSTCRGVRRVELPQLGHGGHRADGSQGLDSRRDYFSGEAFADATGRSQSHAGGVEQQQAPRRLRA